MYRPLTSGISSVQVVSEDLKEAMRQSAQAASLATRASFNHEMLAMLYFPDEHKWAVYTPLFGPVAVPLLVALSREIKEYKRRRREKQKEE
jgi:phosphatidylinositol glycan class S